MSTDRDGEHTVLPGADGAPAAPGQSARIETAPDGGTPADTADVTDTPSDHIDVEQSPTFQGLVALRDKLTAHANGLALEKEQIGKQLNEEIAPAITELERQLAKKRESIQELSEQQQKLLGAKDALGITATGLLYSGDDLKRTKDVKTDRAKRICAELFGREDILPLLLEKKPYDESAISGLSLEITALEKRVIELQQRLDEVKAKLLEPRLRTLNPEYQAAHAELEKATKELATARTKENTLSTELQHLLESIHALDETITELNGQPDAFQVEARRMSNEGRAVANNLRQAREDESSLQGQLDAKRKNETHLRDLASEYQGNIHSTNGLIEKFGETMEILKRAVYTSELTPNLKTGLDAMVNTLVDMMAREIDSIDETLIKIGVATFYRIIKTIGIISGMTLSDKRQLNEARRQLDTLLVNLQDSVAVANSPEGSNLKWHTIDNVVVAAMELKKFLDEKWPELNAGSEEKIAIIQVDCAKLVENVLGELKPVKEAQARIRASLYPPKDLAEVDFANIDCYPTDDLCRYLKQAETARDEIKFGLIAAELRIRPLENPAHAQAFLTVARAYAVGAEKDKAAKDAAIELVRKIRDLRNVTPEIKMEATNILRALIPSTHATQRPEESEAEGPTEEEVRAFADGLLDGNSSADASTISLPVPPVAAKAAVETAAPAAAVAPAAPTTIQNLIDDIVQDAKNAEAAKDWDAVITITTNLITRGIQDPQTNADVNLMLANALLQTGDIQNLHKATEVCDYVCRLRGISPAYVGLAVRLRGQINERILDAATIIRPAPAAPTPAEPPAAAPAAPAAAAPSPAATTAAAALSRLSRTSAGSIDDESE